MDAPPREGFAPHFRKSPVTDPWEPLYSREQDGVVQIGLLLGDRHCNSRGFVHGAVIAALADNAMGLSFSSTVAMGAPRNRDAPARGAVTVNLNVDYVSVARSGQWLEIKPRVIKARRSLGFVDALVVADDIVIARAAATFQILGAA